MSTPVLQKIESRARQAHRRIVLPETSDQRVLRAAETIIDRGFAEVVLLGDPDQLRVLAQAVYVDLDGIETIDHLADPSREEYVRKLHEKRKAKGLTLDQADEMLKSPVYYGGMMVGAGRADGMVAGNICPTRDTVLAALYGVGLSEGNRTVSACSVINTVVPEIGVGGSVIFAVTRVVRDPTVEQLADIAVAAAESCRALLEVEPYVAMLSFSTKGSAGGPQVDKVVAATKLAQQRAPHVHIDGELQLDAAVAPRIARRKATGSDVAGRANTLIFPDLNAGNIGYKLIERLGKGTALGPLLQGLAKPVNDLSRGCREEDIVLITAITSLQAARP